MNRLETLAKLPLLLNSSLSLKRVIEVAINHAKTCLDSEAGTVFLLNEEKTILSFWAATGSKSAELQDKTMPSDKGVVGAVISSIEAETVNDTAKDNRFFSDIDKQSKFNTKNILCAPLVIGGSRVIGAIQVLNKPSDYTEEDLEFIVQLSHQVAVAIENAKLFEELSDKTRRLETLTSRREEMLSVIAHEFRTPLSLIQSSVGMLNCDESEFQKRLHTLLNDGVGRLTRLMQQLGNLKSVSADSYKTNLEELEIADLFSSAVSVVEEGFDSREIELTITGEGKVTGDLTLLTIALSNLLSNAIRFTDDGGKVTLAASSENALCKISVSDTGIGIPEEEQASILEPFYHVANAGYHSSGKFGFKTGGLGLGLSTVKSILKAHNASLQVLSKEAEGSSFSFFLPHS